MPARGRSTGTGGYDPSMSLRRYLLLPAAIILIAIAYWFVSYETAGTVMLLVFGIAMAFVGIILVPTFDDVGPTAPVDENWHERDA
jgi:hypothetical protein